MSPGRARLVFPLPPGVPGSPDETCRLCWQSAAGDNNKKSRIRASPQRGHLPLTSLTALLWGVYKNCTCCNSCRSCWGKKKSSKSLERGKERKAAQGRKWSMLGSISVSACSLSVLEEVASVLCLGLLLPWQNLAGACQYPQGILASPQHTDILAHSVGARG